MIWSVIRRIAVAGMLLGALCGALYILILSSIGMVQHPDLSAIPAVVILTFFAVILGGLSGLALGVANGVAVSIIAVPQILFYRGRPGDPGIGLLLTVGIAAAALNLFAVRAVLNWWLSGGTITFAAFPIVFGWTCAVLTDLRVTWWLYKGQSRPRE